MVKNTLSYRKPFWKNSNAFIFYSVKCIMHKELNRLLKVLTHNILFSSVFHAKMHKFFFAKTS